MNFQNSKVSFSCGEISKRNINSDSPTSITDESYLRPPYDENRDLNTPLPPDMNSPLNYLHDIDLLTNSLDIFNGSVEPTQNISREIPFNESEMNQTFSPAQNSPSIPEQLQFAAEPNDSFRFRYESEINRLNQYQRYLRTRSGSPKYTHPTIKIPQKWLDLCRGYYIQVNLVTIPIEINNVCYVHPYKITSQENGILRNQVNDTLYFPITSVDRSSGEKTFKITLIKSLQSELQNLTYFRQFDLNQYDCLYVKHKQHSKEIISTYHLNKCQLVFKVVEFNQIPPYLQEPINVFHHTSLWSPILKDTHADDSDSFSDELKQIHCIPQYGSWFGGEKCVIIMPNSIKKKEYTIQFSIDGFGIIPIDNIVPIYTRTLLFQIPRCPIPEGDHDRDISIGIFKNQKHVQNIPFTYLTSFRKVINHNTQCDGNCFLKQEANNKRQRTDSTNFLDAQFDQMTIEEKPKPKASSCNQSNNSIVEFQRSVEKYFNELKNALSSFIRTNNPSALFHRTKGLITRELTNSLLLHDAIVNGQTEVVLSLIEQIVDRPTSNDLFEEINERGETPLLIAAKFNQGQIVECILKKRPEYAKQKDKNGNNLFHLLANLKDDQGVELIEKILLILSDELFIDLLKGKNENEKTPLNVAQSNGNIQIEKLLIPTKDEEDLK